ncbi:penicillin-binding protein activator [Halomonas sp. LR5S13]|uniref:penicillin-binding protein activator n=1 Tax=Halomonas rhizosphaerae TaxID=3043296 RepID=UPI0024A8EDE0|nr:penicillin-binding protein activator [Halomonas rhizosphaerae]MDI5922014.1 penicillin-binding protein activator [Halomonas rhizosphaerae]
MKISFRGPLAAALTALLLAGCSFQPGIIERQPDGDPQRLLQQAEQQEPGQAAQSRLEAADILARQGNRTQALEVAKEIDDSRLERQARTRWALLLSELGEAEGDPWAVIQAGQLLDEVDLPREASLTLRERLGMALAEVDEPRAAARALIQVQAETEREDLNDPIWDQLSRLDGGSLATLSDEGGDLVQGWVALAELVRSSGGDIQRLFARLDDWRERHRGHPAARRLPGEITALGELRGQEVNHIAVFLPESGPLAGIAGAIREGIRTHHLEGVDSGARLSFLDSSHGDLEALYREASESGAQVVIGPLDKDAVSELEQRERVPLPTLALNYGRGDRNRALGLFQYGLSAEDEARQAAHRAWVDGHRLASLLVPDNDWGRRVGEAFWKAWRDQGGEVANAVRYNPESSATESARRAVTNPQPDMLFLLALPDYARQVPPTLDYYDSGDLPIYATSHLFEGRLQPRLDHDLDDVLFADIPWQIPDAAVGGVEALPFLDSYRRLREESDPAMFRLMAMGVDAYELARRLPQLQAISGSELFGATGTLSPGDDGRIQRRLPWARFLNGVPQPVLIPGVFGDERAP